eukprot:scaffold1087_cov198-Pinguiococcus_pyrenoidosus.AAC.33
MLLRFAVACFYVLLLRFVSCSACQSARHARGYDVPPAGLQLPVQCDPLSLHTQARFRPRPFSQALAL